MDSVRQFIEQMLKDKGMPELEPEVYEQLVNDLTNRLMDFINRRLLEAMSAEDVEEFLKLVEQDDVDPQQINDFMVQHVSNREQITSSAMLEFRTLYLGADA